MSVLQRWIFGWFGRTLLALIVSSLWLAVIGWWLQALLNQPVNRVEIHGKLAYASTPVLQARMQPLFTNGFISLDLHHLRDALLADPWIAQVRIRRQWPSTLYVELEERQPFAYWNQEGFLDQNGALFHPQQPLPQLDLPKLSGPPDQYAEVFAFYKNLSEALAQQTHAELIKVSALELSQRGAWHFVLNDSVSILLGRDRIDARLLRFLYYWQHMFAQRWQEVTRIDLRYPNGFAVAWKSAQSNGS
ncbi:cell division protein FtsQ [Allopseudospirillum japonicum]|uniref:Cell division protein FtsQ n=1 Tax=Allopseudospirillum japonicum TaxID=64971 RepID=A0A1H6QJD7_9GAMM|nr:cell division protein FtsQ/DivIB [Allopseudospirillum japonicum]SEI40257.1 cell division protein FtsQ [Allopseudospirillum japonicum]